MSQGIEVPPYLEGTALGVLVAAGVAVIAIVLRTFGGRAKTEASLFEQMRVALESERAYTMRLLALLGEKQRQFDELARNLVIAHSADLDRMRAEHNESLRRVHQRVDEAEREHGQCRQELSELRRRIDSMPQSIAA